MAKKGKMSKNKKKDIVIAILLFSCLMIGIAIGLLLENKLGVAVDIDGKTENIKVFITEVCTRNRSIISDSEGNYSDYIELYNQGITFNLRGFALTDNRNKIKYVFGDQPFETGQYLVIFLDGKNVSFALNSDGGETIYLLTPDRKECTSVKTVAMESDHVMAFVDGKYIVTDQASPGYPNTEQGVEAYKSALSDPSNILVINEVLVSNSSALPSKDGNYYDIIELKNITDREVSAKGFYLSDKPSNPQRYALPDVVVPSGGFLIVYASGHGTHDDGEIHASFGLSPGETLLLAGPGGRYTSLETTESPDNISQSRVVSAEGVVTYQKMSASPGFDNTEDGVSAFEDSRIERDPGLVISEVMLRRDETAYGGDLNDVIEITNITESDISTKGWYISDDLYNTKKYALPEMTIKPGQYPVFIADGQDLTDGEVVHLPFLLSKGESLYLFTPENKICVPASIISAGRGNSWQIEIDGGDISYVADRPSLGFANTDSGREQYETAVRPTGIEISEAVSKNTKFLAGPYGTYHDFVELYNNSDRDISLAGLYLSDDLRQLERGALPDVTVKAGSYIVFILSSKGQNTPSGYTVLPFALAAAGETLYLSDGNKIIDCMVIPALMENQSYGRPQGSAGFGYLANVTPKTQNSTEVLQPAPKPMSVTKQGVYNDIDNLAVTLTGKGTIRYTLDASEPNTTSAVYNGPLLLTKTTVVRARCYSEEHSPGQVADFIYVINEGHDLEVASIVTTPSNLWDYYTGIYVEGPNASSEFPHVGANYWQRWEKDATVSFFAKDGTGFSEPCGLRIFGAYSRALDMKSFACFFRTKYGTPQLDYKLFEDSDLTSYESFIFRNTGQDFKRARMRDPLITSLVGDMTSVDVQKYRPVVVYLNGEFWGVYYIREKLNHNYIAGNYNVSAESVTLLRANGTANSEYTDLINYVRRNDLTKEEHYQYVLDRIDKENYIDYICAEIYCANSDNGNIRFYKSTETDGKWRWIMYDVDHGFRWAAHNTVAAHLNPAGTGSLNRFSTVLINGLLKNPKFKDEFLRRMAWQINNLWTNERVLGRIDEFTEIIRHDIKQDSEKWRYTLQNWENHINEAIFFQKNRHKEMYKHVKSYFSLTDAQMAAYGFVN